MDQSTLQRHSSVVAQFSVLMAELLQATEKRECDLFAVENDAHTLFLKLRSVVMSACVSTACVAKPSVRCPDCANEHLLRSQRIRRIVTSEGEATYASSRYRCDRCARDYYPFEELNALVGRQFTIGARAAIAEEAAFVPYTRACAKLADRGIAVSPKEVDRTAQEVGGWRREHEQSVQEALTSRAHLEDDEPVPMLHSWARWERDTPAILSVDGAMVRSPQKGEQGLEWFECRAALIAPAVQTSSGGTFHIAGVSGADEIFRRLEAAWRSDPIRNRRTLFIADGASWIWRRVALHFPNAGQVLDIYHASEHVAQAANAIWGEGSPEALRWRKTARRKLLNKHGPLRILQAFGRYLRKGKPKDPAALRRELEYLTAHRRRMPYYQLHEQGLPVGSGAMESAIKQVAVARLRMPGMKWTNRGADGRLTLRAAALSNSLNLTIQRFRERARQGAHRLAEAA